MVLLSTAECMTHVLKHAEKLSSDALNKTHDVPARFYNARLSKHSKITIVVVRSQQKAFKVRKKIYVYKYYCA